MDKNFLEQRFGKGYAWKLNNARIKHSVLDKLEKYYRLKLFVPHGRTYKTVKSVEDFNDAQDYEHLVNFKLKCPLSYLYLSEQNGMRFCYYIIAPDGITDRNNIELYSTIQRFDEKLFRNETLFEGYLLGADSDSVFLLEDLVIHDGHTVNKNLEERIKIMNTLLDYSYRSDPVLNNYQIVLKDYVEYTYIRSFATDYLHGLSYKPYVTGLVFSPLGKCVVHLIVPNGLSVGTDGDVETEMSDRFSVVRAPRKTKACFLVKETEKPDVYHLLLSTLKGDNKYYDIASIPDKKSSTLVKELLGKSKKGSGSAMMVCQYDSRPHIKRWQPVIASNRKTPDKITSL
jgi:hypothetical protein